jgi:hypothetical protein
MESGQEPYTEKEHRLGTYAPAWLDKAWVLSQGDCGRPHDLIRIFCKVCRMYHPRRTIKRHCWERGSLEIECPPRMKSIPMEENSLDRSMTSSCEGSIPHKPAPVIPSSLYIDSMAPCIHGRLLTLILTFWTLRHGPAELFTMIRLC